ncbi:MAG: helix-turn-helix transcriptional regulator [Candidatus Izemoplasmatales bacterium]|jgi:transcriptional regulator with XRE-family HTH domain|nr:helix-turn-helix transcriptional regulator [Candidatus Izemoplasmatales bacterium]MDD3865825.1 helix-turn-helix transcriptional regulator [Candidatus Izemoplasmatales bacterium]
MLDFYTIGNKIRDLRVANQYNQDQIAEKLFVSRQAVSRWELGQTLPSVDNLIELSRIFRISFEEILCMNEPVVFEETNIFAGHDRNFIVKKIIEGDIQVDLAAVFYQFSNAERLVVLKAIKSGKMKSSWTHLWVKLTPEEQKYLKNEVIG